MKFERILDTITDHVPFSFLHFAKAIPLWVKNRLWIGLEVKKKLKFKGKVLYASHHQSHAASAFYSSPFKDAAIITIDGVGEYATTTIAIGGTKGIETLKEQHFPHSLGLIYSAFTQYCGFKVNSGEYKLMGLAPYGKPIYKQQIYDHLIKLFPDGSYELNMKYFSYTEGLKMINHHFENVFGKPARKRESTMDPFYQDIAASIQEVLEEVVLKLVAYTKELTQKEHVVFAGGVILNCKLNQKIVEADIFKAHYFYPSAGDAGTAVGAAYLGWYGHLNKEHTSNTNTSEVYLGNWYDDVEKVLNENAISYTIISDNYSIVAQEIANGKIVGWYNSKMEFGPRALGNRSILADPRKAEMKDILNEKIKLRESFRPFAPAILEENAHQFFELYPCNYNTMMVTAKARPGTKDLMPAVVHHDDTARIQTVSVNDNEKFYQLIQAFYTLTGCPALINTSFNVRGEPIVESLEDALRAFLYTDIDILVFNGKYMVTKEDHLANAKTFIQPKTYAAD